MYNGCSSFVNILHEKTLLTSSLHLLPKDVARNSVHGIVEHISHCVAHNSSFSFVDVEDQNLLWVLQCLSFGIQFSYSDCELLNENELEKELERMKHCVNIYTNWLQVLYVDTDSDEIRRIPSPIVKNPEFYCDSILWQLFHAFVHRKGVGASFVGWQSFYCKKILRTLEKIASHSDKLNYDLWCTLLLVVLAISDTVFSFVEQKDDIAEQLSFHLITTLCYVWLLACKKCFPSPSLWKTFRALAFNWRHNSVVMYKWADITITLSQKLCSLWWNHSFIVTQESSPTSNINNVVSSLPADVVVETWFRFLHVMNCPADITNFEIMSKMPLFVRQGITNEENIILNLLHLPSIFFGTLSKISRLLSIFFGIPASNDVQSVAVIAYNRPSINSIFHLLGYWLLKACLVTAFKSNEENHDNYKDETKDAIKNSVLFTDGQALSFGLICQLFCSKSPSEEVDAAYCSRFYAVLSNGLNGFYSKGYEKIVYSILTNSSRIFQSTLPGVNILLPRIIDVLEFIVDRHYNEDPDMPLNINDLNLRNSCIKILMSAVCLPFHFDGLTIDFPGNTTMYSYLQNRISALLLNFIVSENEAFNFQKLLVGIRLIIQNMNVSNVPVVQEKILPCFYHDCIKIVCKLLTEKWKDSYLLAQSCLEFLMSLASDDINLLSETMVLMKTMVKSICDFIDFQLKKERHRHIKDMHSSIVLAYNCCMRWITHKPFLLEDQEILLSIAEIIELGISGTKSNSGEIAIAKAEKEQKPASRRVEEAAESILNALFELTEKKHRTNPSIFPDPNESHSFNSDVRYFMIGGICLAGFVENRTPENKISSVRLTFRGAFGKSHWVLDYRQAALTQQQIEEGTTSKCRPMQLRSFNINDGLLSHYLNENTEQEKCVCDYSFPSMSTINSKYSKSLKVISSLRESAHSIEKSSRIHTAVESAPSAKSADNYKDTLPARFYFQSVRLLLSHFNNFSSEFITSRITSSFVPLHSSNSFLFDEIKVLDSINHRMFCPAHIFYFREKENVSVDFTETKENVDLRFYLMLKTLGRMVDLENTADKRSEFVETRNRTISELDGKKCALYWSDDFTEVFYCLPCYQRVSKKKNVNTESSKASEDPVDSISAVEQKANKNQNSSDVSLFIAWLEAPDDVEYLKPDDVAQCLKNGAVKVSPDLTLIYICPLLNGTFKLIIKTTLTKIQFITAFSDGIILNFEILSKMLLELTQSFYWRKFLESESSQGGYMARKSKLNQIFNTFSLSDQTQIGSLSTIFH